MWNYIIAENFEKWNLNRNIGNEEDDFRKKSIVWWRREAKKQGFGIEE